MKTKNIILGAILAIIGIIMIAIPDACIKAVVVLVGLAAVAFSVYNLLVVYKNTEDSAFKKTLLIKSICTFVIGLISIVCPFALVKTVATIWKIISDTFSFTNFDFDILRFQKRTLCKNRR